MDSKGFTFIELLLVISLLGLLFTFSSMNFNRTKPQAAVESMASRIIADIKEQQLKSMLGDTDGTSSPDTYSIHFNSTRYTLFAGQNYSSSNLSNLDVTLPNDVQIDPVSLPNNQIIFSRLSGEVSNFSNTQKSIVIKKSDSSIQKTININKYGVITVD